jgi:hypothetical protein
MTASCSQPCWKAQQQKGCWCCCRCCWCEAAFAAVVQLSCKAEQPRGLQVAPGPVVATQQMYQHKSHSSVSNQCLV